jgi:hypothetical protein
MKIPVDMAISWLTSLWPDEPAQPISTETTVNLLVDGKVVYSATGDNSETLGWRS